VVLRVQRGRVRFRSRASKSAPASCAALRRGSNPSSPVTPARAATRAVLELLRHLRCPVSRDQRPTVTREPVRVRATALRAIAHVRANVLRSGGDESSAASSAARNVTKPAREREPQRRCRRATSLFSAASEPGRHAANRKRVTRASYRVVGRRVGRGAMLGAFGGGHERPKDPKVRNVCAGRSISLSFLLLSCCSHFVSLCLLFTLVLYRTTEIITIQTSVHYLPTTLIFWSCSPTCPPSRILILDYSTAADADAFLYTILTVQLGSLPHG